MVYYPAAVGIDPSGDLTGVTDTAAINAVVQGGKAALLSSDATYYIGNILPDSFGAIIGQGPSSILQAVTGTTGSAIALKNPASTHEIYLANFTLNAHVSGLNGIYLDNTAYAGSPSDTQHTLMNIFVFQAGGDGFKFGNNIRAMRVYGCQQYYAEGYGFNIGTGTTDCMFTNCISGPSANHGFYVNNNSDNFLIGCKAFYSGYDTNLGAFGTTEAGIYLNSCARTMVVGCCAEQSALNGIDMQSCTYTTVTACTANNNSAGPSITNGVGFNTNACTNCVISSNSGNNNAGLSPGTQAYGLQVAGTQTNTTFCFNVCAGGTGTFNYVSGSGYVLLDAMAGIDISGVFTKLGSNQFNSVITADGGMNTAGSAPVLTALGAVSGTAIQLTDTTRDYMVYLEVTTAGTATSISLGHTSAASDITILTSVSVAVGDQFSFRLPAGWYFKWTGTTTAIGNQVALGC